MDIFSFSPTHSVAIDGMNIKTTVVGRCSKADKYVEQLRGLLATYSNIMALHVEMKYDSNGSETSTVAILHLSVGARCVIFQLGYMDEGLPHCLKKLLLDSTITFVGIGIETTNEKLTEAYRVTCENVCDPGELCAWFLAIPHLQYSADYHTIGKDALELQECDVPYLTIPKTSWSNRFLSLDQINDAARRGYVTAMVAWKFL